jgi:streptogramin lyase
MVMSPGCGSRQHRAGSLFRTRYSAIVLLPVLAMAGCTLSSPLRLRPLARAGHPPQLTSPALAIIHDDPQDNAPGFVAVSVSGSGFGRPQTGGRQRECGWPGSGAFLEVISGGSMLRIPSLDRRVVLWNDTQIAARLPASFRDARVRVCTPAGAAGPVAVTYYVYDHYAVPPSAGTNAAPLALTVDAQHRVWINEEFHLDLKFFDPSTQTFTRLDIPKPPDPGPFAMTVVRDGPTQISQNGEAIVSDDRGRIWFTEGGGEPYAGVYPDHSRVVMYDPAATDGAPFRVYNVPGDRNGVFGVAWDAVRQRVWFTQMARVQQETPPVDVQRASILSFDPERIPSDVHFDFQTLATCTGADSPERSGVCSNASSQPCLGASDCVLADQVCRSVAADERGCYLAYEVPGTPRTYIPAHVVVHPDGSVWYTAYWGGNCVGHLDPDTASVTIFPLPRPRGDAECDYVGCRCLTDAVQPACWQCCAFLLFGTGPWDIKVAAPGDVVFTEYVNGAVGRFRRSELGNPDCTTLAAGGGNPCIDELLVAPEGLQVHSLALDREQNVWFTQAGPMSDPAAATSVGYVKPDWSGFVVMPPLSLYPFWNSTGEYCPTDIGAFVSFNGAGIAIDQDSGDIWFADYCRKRLGRLRRL